MMNAAVETRPTWVKFQDLEDHRTIVIHTGADAQRCGEARDIWQRTHNLAIEDANPIGPETEPTQTLYVSPNKLEESVRLFKVADRDSTKRIIVHRFGQIATEKEKRLIAELMKQAPNAEICTGSLGQEADLWGLVDVVKAEQAIEQEANETRRVTRFPLVSGYSGFDNQASYLIKGVLPANGTTAIYGPSGSFKSFLAVSWACHIATGREWDGHRVTQGAVLYVVGEGGVGVPRRLRAWADQYMGSADIPSVYRIDMPVFMAVPEQVAELKIAAEQVKRETGSPVRLIVVDTVARCFGGGDENRAADMGAFIAGCDEVKAATGATILLVHHTGKQEDNGARGSSAFRAALDAEYLVKREAKDSNSVILRNTKMKDDEPPPERAYDLRTRVVTFDSEGDEVTSLVVVDAGREPEEPEFGGLSPTTKALYQAVKQATGSNGRASKGATREAFKVMVIGDNKPNMSNFSRYLKTLEVEGLVDVSGDEILLIQPDGDSDE